MLRKVICLISLILTIQWAYAVPNKQTHFSTSNKNNAVNYEYRWFDHKDVPRSIAFSLDPLLLKGLPLNQSTYQPVIAMRYVRSKLMKIAKTVNPRQARIDIQQRGAEISIGFRAEDTATIQRFQTQFQQHQDEAYQDYLHDHYYEMFTPDYGKPGVKADHRRYIQAFRDVMKPVANAFYNALDGKGTPRQYINLVLSWVQSIPYNELTGRGESNGSGFLPPVALMNANLGDCDSKSVLAATIIRNLLPEAEFQLVIMPNHALLGITIQSAQRDVTLDDRGRAIILMEPTGPAPLPLGDIAPYSLQQVNNGAVTLQRIL